MAARPALPTLRHVLALYYALHADILRRLDGPLSPAMRALEQRHLARLEQIIGDAEGRLGQIEAHTRRLP
jgi:hypothetical protein